MANEVIEDQMQINQDNEIVNNNVKIVNDNTEQHIVESTLIEGYEGANELYAFE